eukprot:scaffold232893_cov30-Tisochrysis_lutea.AAC.6
MAKWGWRREFAVTSKKGNSAAVWLPRMKWTVSSFSSILPKRCGDPRRVRGRILAGLVGPSAACHSRTIRQELDSPEG